MVKRIILSLLLAAEITVISDVGYALFLEPMPFKAFVLIFAISAAGIFLIKKLSLRDIGRIFLSLMCVCFVALALVVGQLVYYGTASRYERVDEGKAELFANREVMIFAPHQDDELSMLSGSLPEYLNYGSNVRIVFVTNGDYMSTGEIRLREALNVAEYLGIAEENVIFLGYGDGMSSADGLHIYNAPEGEVLRSEAYHTATYGLESHPAYRQGREYTRQNIYEDIRDVILEYRPDVIFNMAFEPHGDHRATAFLVEEAMAEILSRGEGYTPLLLESASYHTSYYGTEDFYSENILSIPNPFDSPYNEDMHVYNWDDRVRLPVDAATLSRGLWGSSTYKALGLHATQGCNLRAESIISGDTVFWHRDTSSLSYTANIQVSSGEGKYLNNFKLLDSSNINSLDKPFEDLWLPTDSEKCAKVTFDAPVDISEIKLYDNPSLEDNVLKAKIVFDDGSFIETGALEVNGSETSVLVDKKRVFSFEVKLLETQGERAGLTELEVYEAEKDYGLNFVKIQNLNGDFVYDYYIKRNGVEYCELYTAGDAPDDMGEYILTYSTKSNCFADFEDGKILVSCPVGQSCTVSVSTADGRFTDTVLSSNPGVYKRSIGQEFESYFLERFYNSVRLNNCFNIARDIL